MESYIDEEDSVEITGVEVEPRITGVEVEPRITGVEVEPRITGVEVDIVENTGVEDDIREITGVFFNTDRCLELGRGSDAAVYRGTWHGTPVAVKLLHEALVDPSNAEEGRVALLARFLQEGRRLRRLRHPNIVMFWGLCRSQVGLPALVTELMDGTLMDRYNARPPLGLLQELRLLRDVSAALSYLHSLDIIHRDLTTSNVLVSKEGRAKVADFGLSRSLHDDSPEVLAMTQASGTSPTNVLAMTQAPGTLLYMSPESLTAEATYDLAMDIFSFGVLMMALILRREPDSRLLASPNIVCTPSPSGSVVRTIPEVQRRIADLGAIPRCHPMFSMIYFCLNNSKDHRPTAQELFANLDGLVRQLEGGDHSKQTSEPWTPVSEHLICTCSV